MGSGDSLVVRPSDSWWKGPGFESRQERRENILLRGQLSVLTLIFCTCSTPVLPQQHVKDPGHSTKSGGGRLQLNTHTPYLCGFEWSVTVNWCMVKWCKCIHRTSAETAAVSRGTSHATTKECYQHTASVDIKNTRYKRIVTHSESHATWAQWVCSRAENTDI